MSIEHREKCKLNCCRYKLLQQEIAFYEREAKLLRENVEAREKLQLKHPDLRPATAEETTSQQDLKDQLFILKLKARKMLAIMRMLGRQIMDTQSFFELNGLKFGTRYWAKEQQEWTANEVRIDELKGVFEEQAPIFIELQKAVWMNCYAVVWSHETMKKRKANPFAGRDASKVRDGEACLSVTAIGPPRKQRPSLLSVVKCADEASLQAETAREQAAAGRLPHISYASAFVIPRSKPQKRWRLL